MSILDFAVGICYTAHRQKITVSMVTNEKPQSCDLWGFSIPLWVGGLSPRQATSYSSPSSHLQI